MLTIDPQNISQPELHRYMLTAVAPRPIAFASTMDADGNINLSPFSFFNVFSSNPPILVFSPSRRGRDGSTKDTYENVRQLPEVTINIVNFPIVEQMSLASTEYGKGVNEFLKAGLSEVPGEKVKPPRVGESPVSFECVVEDIITLGDQGGAGNLVLCRVLLMHIREEYLDEAGKLDTVKLDLVSRMGGSWYSRVIPESLFEIPKPLRKKGIGVDSLPEAVQESNILTGNNLGRLGNLETEPTTVEIDAIRNSESIKIVLEAYSSNTNSRKDALHRMAQSFIEKNELRKALAVVFMEEARA